jgi:hypothetical protein
MAKHYSSSQGHECDRLAAISACHRLCRQHLIIRWSRVRVPPAPGYAFTCPLAGHMLTNYDGVLKVDGEVGNKKVYDPRRRG